MTSPLLCLRVWPPVAPDCADGSEAIAPGFTHVVLLVMVRAR